MAEGQLTSPRPLAERLQHAVPTSSAPLLPGFAAHEPNAASARGRGWGRGGRGGGTLTDDAHCHAESGEDRRLEQGGTAYVALLLTVCSLAAASEGPTLCRIQREAEPRGV